MTERHLSDEQIDAFVAGTLGGVALLDADDHIANCARCREVATTRARVRPQDLLHALAGEHLTYEDLESICDGAAPPPAHLGRCAGCRAALGDLETIRDGARTLAPSRRPWVRYAIAAGAGAALVTSLLLTRDDEPAPRAATPVATTTPRAATPAPAPSEEIRDGSRTFRVDAAGRIDGLAADPVTIAAVEALLQGSVDATKTESLRPKTGVLLGEPADAASTTLLAPLGTIVRDATPEFRWTPEEITARVSIYDENFDLVAESGPVQTGRWIATKALQRGRTYRWQLTVTTAGKELVLPAPPQPEARFAVMSEAEVRAVESAERTHAGSHLLLGATYLHAGLLDDAERELRALATANPASPVAARLLETVRNVRRQR